MTSRTVAGAVQKYAHRPPTKRHPWSSECAEDGAVCPLSQRDGERVCVGQTGRCVNTGPREHPSSEQGRAHTHFALHCAQCGCSPCIDCTEILVMTVADRAVGCPSYLDTDTSLCHPPFASVFFFYYCCCYCLKENEVSITALPVWLTGMGVFPPAHVYSFGSGYKLIYLCSFENES